MAKSINPNTPKAPERIASGLNEPLWCSMPISEIVQQHTACMVEAAISLFKTGVKRKSSSRRSPSANDESEFLAYDFVGFPDKEQAHLLSCNIGCCRFLWNRMLSDRLDFYAIMGETLLNEPTDYKDIEGLEWLSDADSSALSNVQQNLEKAFSEWLSGEKGCPNYKKKHVARDSYKTSCTNDNIRLNVENGTLKLPKIKNPIRVRCHRDVRPGGMLKSVTVSHEPDGSWHFVVLFEYAKSEYVVPDWMDDFLAAGDLSAVRHTGIDMSLTSLYVMPDGTEPYYTLYRVLSDGKYKDITVKFEKQYRKYQDRIAREQRKLSHMVKDSNNYARQCIKIAKLHAKAKHARTDFLRQMAVRLSEEYDIISIENLNMAAMKKSLNFGKSASDIGWGKFTTFLEQACAKNHSLLIRVSRWFPSSKKCSCCGFIKKDLKIGETPYICPRCGNIVGRDPQAAGNIDREGLRLFLDAFAPAKAGDAA